MRQLLKVSLLVLLAAGAVLSLGAVLAQADPPSDGAHRHLGYETRIAALEGTVYVLSEPVSVTPSSTATRQRPPSPTEDEPTPDSPTSLTATALTDLPPTFTPSATLTPVIPTTPSRTPTPSSTPIASATPFGDCATWADFEANTAIKRRAAPSLNGTILSPGIPAGGIEVVCYETLTAVGSDGLRWIKVSADREEWFAVGQQTPDGFQWWGEITLWR